MKKLIAQAVCAAVIAPLTAGAENIPNPVIPDVADIGVLNYNGKYYLGGCRTDGDFYISEDLVNWSGPVHVIDMDNDWSRGSGCANNQIHSNDMVYHNGTVHAYWSVNYWGDDLHAVHVVHSEASDPMGPYAEPVKDRWMDNRIDPKVFRDDNGDLYMYMVRFTEGNAIWVRKMKNYREFDDDVFMAQFNSLPATWERTDNVVAEGPWVMKYHGQYYMMYNANHTGGEWGNYQLGVAQAPSPTSFNHGNKYPHPVAGSNQNALDDNYVDLLAYSDGNFTPEFAYTTAATDNDWMKPGFDDSRWEKGAPGFANRHIAGSTTYRRSTEWNTPTLRARKHFNITDRKGNYALRLTHDGDIKVFINGKEIYARQGSDYRVVNLTAEQKKALAEGDNIIAIEASEGRHGRKYLNVELFDMGGDMADPEIVWTPGQPNILRGPNGLEWWLIYMANGSGGRRSQYVDRVHFFGDKLWVDGISHPANPGFHPTPAMPAYGDTFDSDKGLENWAALDRNRWNVADGELKLSGPGMAEAMLDENLASPSYLWEANIKASDGSGVYAIYQDSANNVKIGFDKNTGSLAITEKNGGAVKVTNIPLYDDFRWDVYHRIRAERDGNDIAISLDEMRQPEIYESAIEGMAVPGIYASQAGTAFDGIIYTVGFDDGNDRMNGWMATKGRLTPTKRGASASGEFFATKGKPSTGYEFTAQVSDLTDGTAAGFYPLYIDSRNYVSAILDADRQQLVVTTVRNGKTTETRALPLDRITTLYPDIRFTDSYEKGYTTDCPVKFDAIYLNRHEAHNRDRFVENMFAPMAASWLAPDGSWSQIDTSGAVTDKHPAFNRVDFEPVKASRLRFINRNARDGAHHIGDIRIHELFKESYNLRAVREGNTLHLLVDGREVATMPLTKELTAPSSIALASLSGNPEFHGVMFYHR